MHGLFRKAIAYKSLLTIVVVIAVVTAAAQEPTPISQPPSPLAELKLNSPIPRKLAGGHSDTFTVRCNAGDFLRVIADQKGIDVAVSIFDPAGKSLVDADSPNNAVGPESASAICPATAAYTIRVSSADASVQPGEYVIHLDALRPPQPNDRLRIEAEQAAYPAAALIQGDKQQKLEAAGRLNSAVERWTRIGDTYEAQIWGTTLAILWSNLGETDKSLKAFQQALDDARTLHDHRAEAEALGNLAQTYLVMGQQEQALEYFNRALPMQRELKDRVNEEATLNGLGQTYQGLGKIELALDAFSRSLAIAQELNEVTGQADTLGNLGLLYESLGQHQKSLELHLQALQFARQLPDRVFEATTLDNIGTEYAILGEPQKALESFTQALALSRKVGDRPGEGIALQNTGSVYQDLKQYDKALSAYFAALAIERETRDLSHQSITLNNIGKVYSLTGDHAAQVSCQMSALAIAREVRDPDLTAATDSVLMVRFHNANQNQIAILFGIDAIDNYQQMRRDISGLDKSLRADFVQSKSSTYRLLAEFLIQVNRLDDAEHVLDLLKTAELSESIKGAVASSAAEPLALTEAEKSVLAVIEAQAKLASASIPNRIELSRLQALATPTPADMAKFQPLTQKISASDSGLADFFQKTLPPMLANSTAATSTSSNALSVLLPTLGPGVIGIYTLVSKEFTYFVVNTPSGVHRYYVKITTDDLNKLISQVRESLSAHTSSAQINLAALGHLLLAPIAVDIAAASKASPDHIPTLLWSLDGSLRYVPLNALYDSNHYFVEAARNVVITPESQSHLDEPSMPSAPRELAMGISRSYDGLPALNGVTAELDAVVQDPAAPASHGPISGRLLPNDAFTLAALETNLQQKFPIVHIASHFVFKPGDSGSSYLLLSGDRTGGTGYQLTLLKLDTDPKLSFAGTRLVTLSACSTAASDTGTNGREMDSLGMIMQQRGAAAVLATLWDVNDASTAQLMADFYRRWATTPGIEKVEALRQAQLAMLHNTAILRTATGRGTTVVSTAPAATYAHPYYWAPFVLIGNFR